MGRRWGLRLRLDEEEIGMDYLLSTNIDIVQAYGAGLGAGIFLVAAGLVLVEELHRRRREEEERVKVVTEIVLDVEIVDVEARRLPE